MEQSKAASQVTGRHAYFRLNMKDSHITPVHGGETLGQKEDHGVQKKVIKNPKYIKYVAKMTPF